MKTHNSSNWQAANGGKRALGKHAGFQSESETTATKPAHTPTQANLRFNSVRHLMEWEELIAKHFKAGARVFIERSGYGTNQYALLNAPRVINGESVTLNMENNGLPYTWAKALSGIIAKAQA